MAKKSLKDALILKPKSKPLKKSTINIEETEKAVEQIHAVEEPIHAPKPKRVSAKPKPKATPAAVAKAVAKAAAKDGRTKRVTVDIPIPLHAAIKMKTFQEGISIKEYLLTLAERDLGV